MKSHIERRRRVSLLLVLCALLAVGLTALAGGGATALASLPQWEPLAQALGLDVSNALPAEPARPTQDEVPVVVDFGGAPNAPVAGLDQWVARQNGDLQAASLSGTPITGPKTVVVLRVYFNDYANASNFTQAEVQALFDRLDQLWRDTSYNKISIVHRVSTLYQLPSNRSAYIDDFADGDLSNGGKYQKVLDDAVANAPGTVNFSGADAVFVLMAETAAAQFHRGQANKCSLPIGAGGANRTVGCGIFSENPSENADRRWGRWAHEMGHAFQAGGPAHPSNYNNAFELMDASYPGQTGVFEKLDDMGFPGWLPGGKYATVSSANGGEQLCLYAEEYDLAGKPNLQAIKANITGSLYYMISVRRRVLGDDITPIPNEGVLIERVSEGAAQWVTVMGKDGDRNKLWQSGDTFDSGADGIQVLITPQTAPNPDEYCVTVRYDKRAIQPDVMMAPWTSAPGNTWETTDIWVDSPVNGYGTFRYGSWSDLRGGTVPRGNGDDPAVNLVNRLYARVRNVGTQTATNIVVRFQITDPPGLGIAGANGWANIGSVSSANFPALAALNAGDTTDVYIEWTPNFPLTQEQIAAGNFNFHTCVRVKIDTVAGETVIGNQDGDREQENIDNFQAVTDPGGPRVYDSFITLRNDDLVDKKFFSLSYSSTLPAAWVLDINGGTQGVWLNPDETRQIPILIKPQGPAVVGSIFGVDVRASYQQLLVSDLDPNDKHPADMELGGARVEARVLEQPEIKCEAVDQNEIRVTGQLSSASFDKLYSPNNPFRVMVQGVDGKRRFIPGTSTDVVVNRDGSFEAFVYSQKDRIEEVVCLFAGTDMLASAGSGYVRVKSNSDSPLPTATRTPIPTATPTNTAMPIPNATNTPTSTPTPEYSLLPFNPVLELKQPIILNSDLSVFGIEITQGIQCFDTSKGLATCPDNSLPVALGKLTAARVYLRYSHLLFPTRSNTPVRLYMSVNNGPWQQANTQSTARSTLDQAQASNSANFIFTIGGSSTAVVRFYAVVDPNGVVDETNETNNRYPSSGYVTMTFRQRENLKIISQPVDYHPAAYAGTRLAQGWAVNGGAANWFNQLLPIRNGGINHSVASGYLDWTTPLNANGQHALIQQLNGNYALLVIFGILFGNTSIIPDHIYGWTPDTGFSGGHADMPVYPHAGGLGVVGIGTDRVGAGPSTDNPGGGALIFGHELIHDYDVKHTNTADSCGSSDSSTAFPYGSSSIQEFGFNPATQKVYDPATTHDVMSYCPAGGSKQGWISPYTWTQMFNDLASTAATAAEANGAQGDVIAARPGFFTLYRTGHTQSVIVNLTVDNPAVAGKESGKLGNLYQVDSGFYLTLPEGDYAVELRNGQSVLSSHPFTVSFESEYHTGGAGHTHAAGSTEDVFDPNPTDKADITLVAPWVDGTTSIALVYKGQVLDERTVSGNSPTVQITEPVVQSVWKAGETQKLAWKGDDKDPDTTLHYAVFFSHDGGQNWQLLASELSESSLELAVDSLAGGVDTRFRVVATDGVNTGMGETPEAISIPNKAPMPVLLEPSSTIIAPNVVVVLRGSATDLEDGSIPEQNLTWSSDVQGELGKGYEVAINTLTPGPHTLTLTAVDSQGISDSASVDIFVGYGLHLPSVQR